MKIDIKLPPEAIMVIAATLQGVYKTKGFTRREKSTLSIAIDVLTKIDAKAVILRSKMSLFDSKKKIKVTLKFHEADMLELLLIQQISTIDDPYIRLLHQNAVNLLNQKLA